MILKEYLPIIDPLDPTARRQREPGGLVFFAEHIAQGQVPWLTQRGSIKVFHYDNEFFLSLLEAHKSPWINEKERPDYFWCEYEVHPAAVLYTRAWPSDWNGEIKGPAPLIRDGRFVGGKG